MADVVLSAKMSDDELLASIDATLKSSEKKFENFAGNINSLLGNIGSNVGQNISSGFNNQIDSMKLKIEELQEKIRSAGTTTVSSGTTATPKASVNMNDYNSGIVSGMQQQDFELLQLNEHYKQLEASSKRAFDTQKNASKEQGSDNIQKQDFELIQLNEHYKQLEINSRKAAQAQATLFKEQRSAMTSQLSVVSKMPTNNIEEINEKLRRLQQIKNSISSSTAPLLNPSEIQSLDTKISNLTAKVAKLKYETTSSPMKMGDVLGMSEKNLNDISAKMKAVNDLRGFYGKGAPELKQLNQEYQRLGDTQKKALSAGVELEKHNNKLATSFENLGRRVMFYAGIAGITQFVSQLFNIRGQFELLERSMGALIGSFQKGAEIFREIQAQALQSPMTIIDLSTSAKQLIAYNFGIREITDTTKRLADISSALGVPMERLVYNLGQIKAKGYLDSRDARDFANAGLAIVPKLAETYTGLRGKIVTTSEVYAMMTKKMVSYQDVMKVINGLTDQGGMFFDFQAKQAQTLKGQLSNLVDAWDIMLNELGKDNQGVMTGIVSGARTLLANWREVLHVIEMLVIAYGSYRAAKLILNSTIGQGNLAISTQLSLERQSKIAALERTSVLRNLTQKELMRLNVLRDTNNINYQNILSTKNLTHSQALWMAALNGGNTKLLATLNFMGLLTKEEIRSVVGANMFSTGLKLMALSVKSFISTLNSMFLMNPVFWIMAVIGAFAEWGSQASQRSDQIKQINKDVADQSKQTVDDLNKYFKDNQPTFALVKTGKMNTSESKKIWEDLKDEIEKTSAASDYFISKLMEIKDVQSRNEAAIKYLKIIKDTSEAMKSFSDSDVMTQDTGPWGIFGKGLISSLESYTKAAKKIREEYKETDNVIQSTSAPTINIPTEQSKNLDEQKRKMLENIHETAIEIDEALRNQGLSIEKNRDKYIEGYNIIREQILKENPKLQGEMLDFFNINLDSYFNTNESAWAKFMQVLKNNSESSFSDITTDSLSRWGGITDKSNKKIYDGINQALEIIKKSNPDFYNTIYRLISNTPEFKIRIGFTFKINELGDFQKDFQKRLQGILSTTSKEYPILYSLGPSDTEDITEWAERLQKANDKNKKSVEDWNTALKSANNIESINNSKKQIKTVNEEIEANAKLLKMFGFSAFSTKELDKEQKKRASAQKKALSEEAQAIKNEIDLIEKLTSNFDKLRQAGVSQKDAIKVLSEQYASSIGNINKVLNKYNITPFNVKDFAGMNVSGQLDYLIKLRDEMKAKGLDKLKPDAFKEVTAQIGKVKVEGKTYDLTKVTEELANRISNIKESYELGVEIESNPEEFDLFSNIFHMDKSDIEKTIKTAKQAAQEIQTEITNTINEYNNKNKSGIQLTSFDALWSKEKQLKYFQDAGIDASSTFAKGIMSGSKEAKDLLSKDFNENMKSWNALLQKYAEYEYKKNEIQKIAAKERLDLIEKFGTDEQYKQAIDLSNKIQISDDPEVITDLQRQLSDLVDKVSKGKPKVVKIAAAITKKGTEDTGTLDFEQYQKTEYWQAAFGDMGNLSSEAIKKLIGDFEGLKTSMKDLSPTQVKELNNAIKKLKDTQGERNPFKQLANSFEDIKKAKEKLVSATQELDAAKESGDADRIRKAEEGVFEAQTDLTEANNRLGSSEENLIKIVSDMYNSFTALRKALGDTADAAVQAAFSIAASIITAMHAVEDSIAILAIIQAALTAINFLVTIFGGQSQNYSKMKESVGALANAISKASDEMTQLLEKSAGKKAISYYNDLIKSNNEIIQSYRNLAEEAGKAGSSMGSHSYAYRNNKELSSSFAEMSKWSGKNITQIQDLYNLTPDALKNIMTHMPAAWAKIDSKTREALENIIEYGDKAKEYTKELNQAITDTTFDDLSSNFMDMLSNLDTSTEDFANNFEKYMRNAIVRTMVYGAAFQEELSNWYNMFASAMADGSLSETEKNILQTAYNNMVKSAKEKVKSLEEVAGVSTSTSELSSLQQGIQGITEETGGALEAYMNGISAQSYMHTEQLKQLVNNSNIGIGVQSEILLQMQQGYQVQVAIRNLLNGAISNNGRSFMVTLTN